MYLNLLYTIVPMLLLAFIFYFLLEKFFNEEREKRSFQYKTLTNKEFLPQKFQAYERIALFLERIRPSAVASRTQPNGTMKSFEFEIVNSIQKEFEHNLSQQIYIHPETWKIVFSAKNATINFIKTCADTLPETASAKELQEHIIKKSMEENIPSSSAILYLQKDIQGEY